MALAKTLTTPNGGGFLFSSLPSLAVAFVAVADHCRAGLLRVQSSRYRRVCHIGAW